MTLVPMSLAHHGNPTFPHRGTGLRPMLLAFLRGVAERLEGNPRDAAGTPAYLDIDGAIRAIHGAALARSTRNTYAGALRRFGEWLEGRPPTDSLLAWHIQEMSWRGLSPPSGALVVAAVKRAVRDLDKAGCRGAEHPVGPLTIEQLERFRREGAGRGRGQAGALRWEDADGMSKRAEAGEDPRGIRDAAVIGVASDALLRVAEASALNAEDVSFQDDGSAHLAIRRSKTDQHGAGAVCYVAPPAAERVRKWMTTAGIESGPLFRPVAGRRVVEKRLGSAAVGAVIKRRAVQAGIMRRVSGHSLRVGTAQSLVENGASLVDVQVAGRWTSPEMPARYVRGQEASRGAVARLRRGEKKVAESACNTRNGGANVE
ncbi:MAG: tyrosine-type recombinase/integrase [Gammaproteobacteria bacterium]|nr:tyrosine-type recombinase/integrase [Gammaproteobacteria bacterium]